MTELIDQEHLKVLLIDDDNDIHFLVKEFLKEKKGLFVVETASDLETGFASVQKSPPHVVLLDLSIPGSQGLRTFDRFHEKVKDVPIVIFTSLDDESAALEAVNMGAQDYLVKGHVTPRMLSQVLRYAVERYRAQEKTRNPQLTDSVTGLNNEQGFSVFAEQYLRSSSRNMNGVVVFLFVLEKLEGIEKEFGVGEAHRALKTTTEILRESFRGSDILARVGNDRFIVMPTTSSPFLSRTVMARIKTSQTYYNTRFNLYRIMLRWEALHFLPDEALSLDLLKEKIEEAFVKYQENLSFQEARS